jgi:ABC-2 type transport system ATP-binding protein
LSKAFRRTEAVNALDLEVPEGSIYAMIGPNGAGKTTTIKLLMNILRASAGSAQVLGVDSRRLSPREFARIGYVSENQEMPDWMTVDYFLRYLRPFYPTWDDALVRDEFTKSLLERAEGTTILISSHDLAEIENFASHVGYIEEGRLRFTEEMGTLADRFRQVELTFEAPPPLPADWPAAWMRPETSAAVVRFIDSRFDSERTPAEIQRLFPQARNVAFHAMSLREIFVALAGRHAKAA